MQNSLFDNLDDNKVFKRFDLPNAEIEFYPDFFSAFESQIFFSALKQKTNWRQEKMFMYGKEVNFPRLTAWYGDNDKDYSFSGIKLKPYSWTETLINIKNSIQKVENSNFNSVLLNLYRNGQDSINWHTDAEKELGQNPIIASVSFGATRKFQLKHKYDKTLETVNIELLSGSLLIMKGETQHFWVHQVPKTNKVIGERINLTFRTIK
ncbi:MAG TPA: alpha-ketoglutarate-dependent dioxygenase AlkB [Bacteroidales bacterium]|nr:alpha-ketoglutarate-dependent dioxygenase AlkB [Bacteroidales bacterium]